MYGTDSDSAEMVEAIVATLDEDIARHFDAAYKGDQGHEAQAVARFVDALLCDLQERFGDGEIRTGGDYWNDAVEAVFGAEE